MMYPSTRRKRLTCVECTRRKIKCDKVLPCRNCRQRGNTCYRSDVTYPSPTAIATPRSLQREPRQAVLTGILASCLNELQTTLQSANARENGLHAADVRESAFCATENTSFVRASSDKEDSAESREAAEIEDAATILEFLAWGRRKAPDFEDMVTDPYSTASQSPGDVSLNDDSMSTHPLRFTDHPSSLPLLQLLLPNEAIICQMVDYHCECLLWYHASFHGRIFQGQVERFLKENQSRLDHHHVDLQWSALLFAVLAGSITCAPRKIAATWGFEDRERTVLAQQFFKAALVCLNLADFTARHSLYGVQCITTMTISAHLLGFSNSHSVKLASAVRIAQSLGMHRLGAGSDDRASNRVRREIGRQLWTELCIQDWFSIPFSESYLIHRRDFNTQKPSNCMNDESMTPMPENVPTSLTYHRVLHDIATLMPKLHDDLSVSQTLFTKYDYVIRYDTQMRTLVSKNVPDCLRNIPLEPSWPKYIPWARHCLAISSAHKIIMIHRKFLWASFTNSAFTFTRKTCLAAAKTIVREQKQVATEDGPILWIYHAFTVAASIILCLDLFFPPLPDSNQGTNRALVNEMISILSQSETSMIATRGIGILRLLLKLESDRRGISSVWDIRSFVQSFCEKERSGNDEGDDHITANHPLLAKDNSQSPFSEFPHFDQLIQDNYSDDLYGHPLLPNSKFSTHDTLEDILLLAQNGGS